MKKQLLSGILFSIVLNILIKTIWIFGIDLNVQRAVGTEAYGVYFSSYGFALLFIMLLDLGISSFNTRNIAQNQHLLQKHFTNLALLKTGIGFLYFIVLFAGALFMQYSKEQIVLLFALGLVQFFTSFILFIRSNISALQLFKLDAVVSVLDRTLLIIICGFWLWSNWFEIPVNIFTFAWIQVISSALSCIIGVVFLFPYVKFQKISQNKAFYFSIVKKSYPFAILTFLMTLYLRFDGIILAKLAPNTLIDAGTFAAAFRLFDAFAQIAILFSAILFPFFAKAIKDKQDIGAAFSSSLSILLFGAIICGTCGFFYATDLANLFYKEHISETASIIKWLFWTTIPYSVSLVAGAYLTANNSIKYLNKIALFCIVINLVLNVVFVPKYGALASAYISFVTQFASAAFLTYQVAKVSNNKLLQLLPWNIFAYVLIAFVCMYFVAPLTTFYYSAIILVVIGFACKMFPISALKNMVFSKLKK